jgi:AcrR family transcriptional regulator
MPSRVNPKRRYESPRRREQAASTRAQILRAAQKRFEQDGYASTTMGSIAREAGVAVKTVYLAFDTKSGVLRAVWDTLLRGEPDIPVAEQPWYREVVEERDPRRQLGLNARNSCDVKRRIGGLLKVIRDAAPVDPDVNALWTLIETDFYANQRVIVETLAERNALQKDLDVARATDILWTLNHPDVWHLLVDERKWTPDRWQQWLAATSCAQLLAPT